jgi:hypothetical protein
MNDRNLQTTTIQSGELSGTLVLYGLSAVEDRSHSAANLLLECPNKGDSTNAAIRAELEKNYDEVEVVCPPGNPVRFSFKTQLSVSPDTQLPTEFLTTQAKVVAEILRRAGA